MEDLESIKKEINRLLNENSFELHSFKFIKKSKQNTLEIVIDRDEDISMDDIVKVSEIISTYLDEHEFTNDAYNLDVSSLGAEKEIKLEKIDKYINRYIYLHVINPINGENSFEGTLISTSDDEIVLEITIKTRKKNINIKKENIDFCRFAIKF